MGRSVETITAVTLLLLISLSIMAVDESGGSPGHLEMEDLMEENVLVFHLEFDSPSFINEGHGTRIVIEGMDNDQRSSAHSIPRMTIPVELPVNSNIRSIRIDNGEFEIMEFDGVIIRNGIDIPSSDLSLWERSIEQREAPDQHFDYLVGTGMNLDTRETVMKLPVSIYPVIPVDDGIEFMRSAELIIEYDEPLFKPFNGPVEYDLLVLSPEEYVDEMEEYSLYRNQTGFRTVVIPLSAITGDRIWNISENDTQEEMKRFIYNAKLEWSIDYVLLAGDVNIMPARQIMVLDNYDDNGNSDGRFLPSDLYFADLFERGTTDFCSWNDYTTDDHDKLYGEYISGNRDNVDVYPDLSIGRIPAGSEAELEMMLDKVKMYELTAKGSDWFMNATLCGTDTFTTYHGDNSGVAEGEYMSDLLSNGALSEFNSSKFYETQGSLVTTSITATVNQGCGFFEMSDHGDYNGWGYTSAGTAVRSSNAAAFKNGYKLPVVVLDACLTHGFDNENASDPVAGKDPVYGYWYYPPGSGSSTRDCLGEWFHKNDNGGAIATYGCTRVGYGSHSTSYSTRNSGYMNIRIHQAYADGYNKTGDMLTRALNDYMNGVGASGAASFKTVTEYVLLGDPTVSVGGVEGTNIIIDSATEEMGILPNETVEVSFNLTNTGFMSSMVTLEPVHPAGWNISIDPSIVTVVPEQLINGTMTITAPEMIEMETIAIIGIDVHSPLMSAPRSLGIPFTVERTYGIEIEMDPPIASSFQGGRVMGHINVTNLGNGPEDLNISIPEIPEEWVLVLGETSYGVDPFGTGRIPFQLEVPRKWISGLQDLEFNVSSNVDDAFALAGMGVDISTDFGLELIPHITRINMAPGSSDSFLLTVENIGNSPVEIDLGWGRTELTGWTLSMDRSTLELPAFSNDTVRITASIPDMMPPLTYRIFINATDGMTFTETSVSINVTRVYGFEVECLEDRKMDIGAGYNYFDIRVRNLGNIFDVYKVLHGEMDEENWTFSTSAAETSVDPGQWKTVRVTFGNTFPLEGNYTFEVIIQPFSQASPKIIELKIDVPAVFNFTLEIDIVNRKALPGGNLTGQLIIGSLSNTPDEYILEPILPEGFECNVSALALITGPGELITYDFTICTDEHQLAGPYMIEFRVISKGSELNISISRLFEIDEVYSIVIKEISGMPTRLEPMNTYQLIYEVENKGNTFDNVNIQIEYSDYISNWLPVKRFTWSLVKPGETRTAIINITVPRFNVTEGVYNISVTMESIGNSFSSGNLSLDVEGSEPMENDVKTNWWVVGGALCASLIILIIVILAAVLFIRKYAGEDIEDLGMEWEGEDDEDEDDEDYDDDWDDDNDDWDDE